MTVAHAPAQHSQFALPRGARGWAVGKFLAVANAWMDGVAIELLAPPAGAHILEIGFGPGVAVKRICRAVPDAKVCGVDASEVMVRQAIRRNRPAVRRGQAELRLGSATSLPWRDAAFDRVLALNNAHLWDPLDVAFSECFRVLRPGGRIVIGFHVWKTRRSTDGRLGTLQGAEALFSERLASRGFRSEGPVRRKFPMGTASFLAATRP